MHASRLIGPGDVFGEIGGSSSSTGGAATNACPDGARLTMVGPWADAGIAQLPNKATAKSANAGRYLITMFLIVADTLYVIAWQDSTCLPRREFHLGDFIDPPGTAAAPGGSMKSPR